MPTKINFNGKEYNSVDEMPPDVRAQYAKAMNIFANTGAGLLADADKNGIPALFEKLGAANINVSTTNRTIIFDGKTYHSVDELPPEAKAKYEAAMAKMGGDADRDGIPDMLEGKTSVSLQGKPVVSVRTTMAPGRTVSSTVSFRANTWLWLAAIAFLLAIIGGLVVLLVLK